MKDNTTMDRQRSSSTERIEARLRELPWPTAAEMAKDLHLSSGTVRKHLLDLVAQGRAERRADSSVPSPRGGGADRFNLLPTALPEPDPTADRLCDTCVREVYGDQLRYSRALDMRPVGTPHPLDTPEDIEDADDDAYDAYLSGLSCDRCARRLYP
jgi:hypothetical protein